MASGRDARRCGGRRAPRCRRGWSSRPPGSRRAGASRPPVSAARISRIGPALEHLLHFGRSCRSRRAGRHGSARRDGSAPLRPGSAWSRARSRRTATACRSAARTAAATADRRRRSARRERESPARAGSRTRAPAAGASRRRDRARASFSRPARPAISITKRAPLGELRRVQPVDAAEERDVLVDGQQLVEREPLRHVADAALDAFGIAVTSTPPTCAVPEVGSSRPHSMRMVVDLPAPLLPRKPKISPRRDVEGHVVDGDELAEAAGQVADDDRRRYRPRARSSRGFARAGRRRRRACDRARPAGARTARRARRCWSRRPAL